MIDNNEIIPLVSIICPAYNHEKFIAQALEGFVMQKTNFPFEIIVHDDASTDSTSGIVREYENKHPGLFDNIYQKENQFSKDISSVFRAMMSKAKGKYIALCEGDDYWTDSYKLQKQVEFLEANPDYVMSFHNVKIWQKDGKLYDNFLTDVPSLHESIQDLARYGQYIQTNTVVFRNVIPEDLPDVFGKSIFGDFILEMFIAQFGKIKYFNECMSVYRYQVGIHSTLPNQNQSYVFHTWMLPLWIYFSKTGNEKIAEILMERIYIYLKSAEGTVNTDKYINYLYMVLGEGSHEKFLKDTIKYYDKKADDFASSAVHEHMRNASIMYLLKVVFYKFKTYLLFK
jgi:glycosyltransferase involved in cell wall biosynthesis